MDLMIFFAILILLSFGLVIFFGAPYLPTLSPQITAAFDLLDLEAKNGKQCTILELGCGDGKVLVAAAEKGYRSIGIEINPILAFVAWARTRKYGSRVQVRLGNFWSMQWPKSDGVFVFLLDRFMPTLDKRMHKYGGKLVSVAFKIPAKKITQEKNGVFLYEY